MWNPARILGQRTSGASNALLARLQKHQGAVRGLEFNPFASNLLASGAGDGDLCIWDVANPSQPSLYPAMKNNTSSGNASDITCLSWNRKVQHILATTTAAGNVIVWDLKKQRPVITLKDPGGRRRCSAVAWNPDVATQLLVASDDDASPNVQLWDLRNSVSPLLELQGHSKGVLGMSWCPQDASFLLTSGKDNRVLVWDVPSGQIYRELPSGSANWRFDVQWAPGNLPGVFAGATFEGLVSLHTLASCQPIAAYDAYGNQTLSELSFKSPNWMQRPSSACLGFGGKLATVRNSRRQLPTGESVTTATIEVKQVAAGDDAVDLSPEFENIIRGADRDALKSLCMSKAANSRNQEESETWEFLQTHFEPDGKQHLLVRLGFEGALPKHAVESHEETVANDIQDGGNQHEDAQLQNGIGMPGGQDEWYGTSGGAVDGKFEQLSLHGQTQPHHQQLIGSRNQQMAQQVLGAQGNAALLDDGSGFFAQSPVDGSSFFDTLNSPNKTLSPVLSGEYTKEAEAMGEAASRADDLASHPNHGKPSRIADRSKEQPAIVDGTPGKDEDAINAAMLVGNYAGAVDDCVAAGRYADAMLIASLIGGEPWNAARRQFMQALPRPFMRVVHAILSGDWRDYVLSRPSRAWKSTLAALLSSAPYDQFEELVGLLAKKLDDEGAEHPAVLCYICAGDVQAAVNAWNRTSGPRASSSARQAVMEKAIILGLGVDRPGSSSALGDLLAHQAESLAANGKLSAAYDLISLVPEESSSEKASVLKDRLYQSGAVFRMAAAPLVNQQDQTVASGYNAGSAPTGQSAAAMDLQSGTMGAGYQAPPLTGPPMTFATGSQQPSIQPTAPTSFSQFAPLNPSANDPSTMMPTMSTNSSGLSYTASAPPPATEFASYASQGGPSAASLMPGGGFNAPSPRSPDKAAISQPAVFQPQQNPQPQFSVQHPATAYGSTNGATATGPPPPITFQQPQASGTIAGSSMQPPAYGAVGSQSMATSGIGTMNVSGQPTSAQVPPPTTFQLSPAPSVSSVSGGSHALQPASHGPGFPLTSQHHLEPPVASTGFQSYTSATTTAAAKSDAMAPATAPSAVTTYSNVMPSTSLSRTAGATGSGAMKTPTSPSGPPPGTTLRTADTSSVPPELRGVVNSLIQLHRGCEAIVGGHPTKKRELDDASKKLGTLLWRMNSGLVSTSVAEKLQQLCAALDAGDFATAGHLQVMLTTSDWEECAGWLTALKRLLKLRQAS